MDESVWDRIEKAIEARPDGTGRGRAVAWLVEKTGMKLQRINNWKTRGVPSSAYEDVAKALGWTVGQVAGVEEPPKDKWPFGLVRREAVDALGQDEIGYLQKVMLDALKELDKMKSEAATGTYSGNSAGR